MITAIKEIVSNYINYANLSDVVFGTVLEVEPIKIKLDTNTNLQLGEPFIIVTDRFKKEPLKAKDRVVLIKATGGQKFVVLDKL
ncbi:TPA: DUF2577 family protein [Escherichia coli]|nr:DUF2577 domain-containing protein [Escherichia coli]HAY3976955.1 DUF2577 domain-containing protein [Escherichia coli]HBB9210926.1 DUF2577 family protein [Escherichia coli]